MTKRTSQTVGNARPTQTASARPTQTASAPNRRPAAAPKPAAVATPPAEDTAKIAPVEGGVAKESEATAAPAAKKPAKIKWPKLIDGEGNAVKIEAWPEADGKDGNYDPKVHKGLLRTDFVNEAPWLDRKADELEGKAKEFRAQAELSRRLGNPKDRAAAKRFMKLSSELDDLKATLKEQGIDPAEFLAQLGGTAEEKTDGTDTAPTVEATQTS